MTILNNDPQKAAKQVGAEAWDRSRARMQSGAVLLAACAIVAGAPAWAQDVAEAARQEASRKNKPNNGLKHVYTEEDLKRAKILTAEDREALDAKKREQAIPGTTAAPASLDAENLDTLPLGDVARMYRALKEFHAQSGDFHLPSSAAVLAAPRVSADFAMSAPREVRTSAAGTPAAPVFSNGQPASAPMFASQTPLAAPKVTHEFGIAKPRATRAAKHTDPVAPMLSNGLASVGTTGATGAVFAESAVVAPQAVAAVAPTTASASTLIANSTMVPSATPAAAREFVMPRPSAIQPAIHAIPTAPAFSPAAAPLSIVVKRGDSFWKLAQINLGDGHRWHEIAAVNPTIVDPQHLVPGTVVNISGRMPAPMVPAEVDGKITVRKGDSLWRIAATKLGFGGFWGCIAKANPVIKDANLIYTGQVLNVPSSCNEKP